MAEKGEEMGGGGGCGGGGGGGGGGAEGDRQRVLTFGILFHDKRKENKKLVLDPTLEKEEGFQFPTSQGMNGKTGVPGRKPISRMQCKPYNSLDEGCTAMKAQKNNNNNKQKQTKNRERETHTYTLTQSCYTYKCSTMVSTVKASEGVGGKTTTTTTKFSSLIKATC